LRCDALLGEWFQSVQRVVGSSISAIYGFIFTYNTGWHQCPWKKRWVIFTDLTLLNSNIVTKLLHHPQEPLNLKSTFLVNYVSRKAYLLGQIAACVFVEYFRQRGVAALVSLRRAFAGMIIAM
jgi:hypothetical protein